MIKNTGGTAGAEVVQVYVNEKSPEIKRPEKELKAFAKVMLKAGEEKQIKLTLDENAFQYFSEAKNKWVMKPGRFNILVGSSSADIRLEKGVDVK